MIEVDRAQVRFDEASAPALADVSCAIAPGERVALIGANGSGKSTLGALMCGMKLVSGGTIRVDGLDPRRPAQRRDIARLVGFVQQSPADQLVCTEVGEEVAFGPRNLGLDGQTVRRRVRRALSAVGLAGCEAREVHALSGGEQQRVALAGVLALDPTYLVLDEMGVGLDGSARASCRSLLARLARQGRGIVEITHDPVEVLGCDRAIVLERGSIVWQGTVRALLIECAELWDSTLGESGYITAAKWAIARGCPYWCARMPADLAVWFHDGRESGELSEVELEPLRKFIARPHDVPVVCAGACDEDRALRLKHVRFAYDERDVVRDVSLSVEPGEVVLVAGPSGSGKSTLTALAAGVLQPSSGEVLLGERPPRPGDVGLVFQSPEQQLFCESVEAELMYAPVSRGCDPDAARRRARRAATRVGIAADLADRDPFSLSGGQARRVGIAAALSSEPSACVFDEPTAGLDARGRAELFDLIAELAEAGCPVLVVSHDVDEWLARVDRVALLSDNALRWVGAASVLVADPTIFSKAKLGAPESSIVLDAMRGAPQPVTARDAACAAEKRTSMRPSDLAGDDGGSSALVLIDERIRIMLLLAMTGAVFCSSSPIALAIWGAMLLGAVALSGARPCSTVRALRPILGLLVLVICANLISCDGSADVRLFGGAGLSFAGGARAGIAVTRIVLLAGFSGVVAATTTPQRIATAVARLMRPLAGLGLPVAALSLELSVALRSIPLVGEELVRIRRAQRARGVCTDIGGPLVRARAWMAVLVPLAVGLLRRADRLAASMDARCYAGATRVMPPRAPLSRRDWAALAIGLLAMILIVAAGLIS